MTVLSALVASVTVAVLIVGGTEKLRSGASFAGTLTGLGITGYPQAFLRIAVPSAELATAAGLMLAPGASWPVAGVAFLGICFAAAGLLSLRADQPVACSCLGAATNALLGWRQVALLPVWIAAAVLVYRVPVPWSASQGLQVLALVVTASAGLHAVKVIRAWRNDSAHRKAIEEASTLKPDMVQGLHVIGGKQ
ncbi:MauE/DoxX family redox-associated membrane protein [Micromonospora zamorensis]|uniref:MauE/DoxX family redox-associated membrane protein n=1 Tax=Micromonospora zamorensis TaxID=709883 RepID=UPI00367C3FE5